MPDRLNFFEPWESPAHHENQLTRALLVVLRYCPIAHQAWLSLIDAVARSPVDPEFPRLKLHSLDLPTFDTQRAHILTDAPQRDTGESQRDTNEQMRAISVLCAADASSRVSGAIVESDRGQVLDGIIRYGDELVIVLESKLHESPDDSQARNINLYGQPIKFEASVRPISWRDVLDNFTDLADQKRSLVSGAEREILNDFLAFVAEHFSELGPYSTLARCAGEPSRVGRRLGIILDEILNTDGQNLPGDHDSVKLCRFEYDSERRLVELHMWPGDTLTQAYALYGPPGGVERVGRVLKLQDSGWYVAPNFHFGFTASGYCWTNADIPVAEYMQHWVDNIGKTGQIERPHWNRYWRDLERRNIAAHEDRETFDKYFTNTRRQTATPRPGLHCAFSWRLDEAERLDTAGQLKSAVRKRINQLLEALGEDEV